MLLQPSIVYYIPVLWDESVFKEGNIALVCVKVLEVHLVSYTSGLFIGIVVLVDTCRY